MNGNFDFYVFKSELIFVQGGNISTAESNNFKNNLLFD